MRIWQLNREKSAKAALLAAAFAALAFLAAACPAGDDSMDPDNGDMVDNTDMMTDTDGMTDGTDMMTDADGMDAMTDADGMDMMTDTDGMTDGTDMMTDTDGMTGGMEMMTDTGQGEVTAPAADQSMRPPLPPAVMPTAERNYVRADFFNQNLEFIYEPEEVAKRVSNYPASGGDGCAAERERSMQYVMIAEDRELDVLIETDLASALQVFDDFQLVDFNLQNEDDSCGQYKADVLLVDDFQGDIDHVAGAWNTLLDNGQRTGPRITPQFGCLPNFPDPLAVPVGNPCPPDVLNAPDLPVIAEGPYPPGLLPEALTLNWLTTVMELKDPAGNDITPIVRNRVGCEPILNSRAGRLENHLLLDYGEALDNPAATIAEELRAAGLRFNRIDVYSAEDYAQYGSETFINILANNPLDNFDLDATLKERFGAEIDTGSRRFLGRDLTDISSGEIAERIVNVLDVRFPYLQDSTNVRYQVRVHSDVAWEDQQELNLRHSLLTGEAREISFNTNCVPASPFNAFFYSVGGAHTFFGDDLVWGQE